MFFPSRGLEGRQYENHKKLGGYGQPTNIPDLPVRLSQGKDLDFQCSLEYTYGLLAGLSLFPAFVLATQSSPCS